MADEISRDKALALLRGGKQGIKKWNALREAGEQPQSLAGVDLSRADLRGVNLSKADLFDANLSRADLFDADLREANLIDVDLSGAKLWSANLSEADLRGAGFAHVTIAAHISITSIYRRRRAWKTSITAAPLALRPTPWNYPKAGSR